MRLMHAIYEKALVAVHLDFGEKATDDVARSAILDLWQQNEDGLNQTVSEEAWPALCAFFSKS